MSCGGMLEGVVWLLVVWLSRDVVHYPAFIKIKLFYFIFIYFYSVRV